MELSCTGDILEMDEGFVCYIGMRRSGGDVRF